MKLPPQSVRKLFRDHFSETSPIAIDRKNLRKEARQWTKVLEKIDGIRMSKHPGDRDSRSRRLCRFTIPVPNESHAYFRHQELWLEYDGDNHLKLCATHHRQGDMSALVSDAQEIQAFVRDVLQRYAKRQAGAKKREKIREFKTKAIIAQVKKLAKEEQFEYATAADTVKLKLYVKLANHELIEIHIPFSRFEKVLPKLRETIQALRELYEEGLKFKINPISRLPWNLTWTETQQDQS